VVTAAGYDATAVGRKCDGINRFTVAFEYRQQLAIRTTPHASRMIIACRHNVSPIARELRAVDAAVMVKRKQQMAIGSVPYPRRIVPAYGHNALPVRREPRIIYRAIVVKNAQQMAV
jgi:hypothetical protein